MVVHQFTLENFLAGLTGPTEETASDPMETISHWADCAGDLTALPREPVHGHDGFATIVWPGGDGLLVRDIDGQLRVIGGYIGDTLGIETTERGKGLSTELILRCCANRPIPLQRKLTTAGHRALVRAHRVAVQRALDDGEDVPEAVRQEHEGGTPA